MYKKIMLGLMFLPLFSSNESLCSSNDLSKPVVELVTYIATKAVENSAYIWTKIVESCTKYIEEHPDKVVQATNVAGGLVMAAAGAVAAKTAGDIYDKAFPKESAMADKAEADVRIKEAQKRSEFLDAEKDLSKCLKNAKQESSKNFAGIPTDCEAKARTLILCDGDYRVAEMARNFNK